MDTNNRIPTYSICFTVGLSDVDDPDDLLISRRNLSPADAQISSLILTYLESISRDYLYFLGKKFKSTAFAQLSFSHNKGVVFNYYSDVRLKTLFEQNASSSFAVTIPRKQAKKLGFSDIKKHDVTEAIRQEAREKYKEEKVFFFDPCAYLLFQSGLTQPVTVNLEIQGREALSEGGGLTTGFLRFPHLLFDLTERYNQLRKSDQTKICLVGPGLNEEKNSPPCIPQFVEIHSIFPNAEYLLLDNNSQAITLMNQQFKFCKFAAYDPSRIKLLTSKANGNSLYAPEKYQKLFQEMKNSFVDRAFGSPVDIKKMLYNEGSTNRVMLKVNPDRVQIQEFDITNSQFNETEKGFDVIVATMSITIAFSTQISQNPKWNFIEEMAKFLKALKENGSLYVDSTIKIIFKDTINNIGNSKKALAIQYFESLLGNKLTLDEIPLADFIPGTQGISGVIDNQTINEKNQNVTTSSILVMTRTSEKVEYSKEIKEEIQLKLSKMFDNLIVITRHFNKKI